MEKGSDKGRGNGEREKGSDKGRGKGMEKGRDKGRGNGELEKDEWEFKVGEVSGRVCVGCGVGWGVGVYVDH